MILYLTLPLYAYGVWVCVRAKKCDLKKNQMPYANFLKILPQGVITRVDHQEILAAWKNKQF